MQKEKRDIATCSVFLFFLLGWFRYCYYFMLLLYLAVGDAAHGAI